MNKSDFKKLQKALRILKSINLDSCLESYRLESICTDLSALLLGSEL